MARKAEPTGVDSGRLPTKIRNRPIWAVPATRGSSPGRLASLAIRRCATSSRTALKSPLPSWKWRAPPNRGWSTSASKAPHATTRGNSADRHQQHEDRVGGEQDDPITSTELTVRIGKDDHLTEVGQTRF